MANRASRFEHFSAGDCGVLRPSRVSQDQDEYGGNSCERPHELLLSIRGTSERYNRSEIRNSGIDKDLPSESSHRSVMGECRFGLGVEFGRIRKEGMEGGSTGRRRRSCGNSSLRHTYWWSRRKHHKKWAAKSYSPPSGKMHSSETIGQKRYPKPTEGSARCVVRSTPASAGRSYVGEL